MLIWYVALLASIAFMFMSNGTFTKANAKPEDAGWWTLKVWAEFATNRIAAPEAAAA